ncbi:hypothetical protein HY857_02170 [Candidatus Saccharibacteria bacterium]|nr:hypothetical protein [Candidatus Saccharibacteria bacterium]
MHVYFSGIGGTGIGPLALIAKQAGYEVSGSDKQDSQYISYLRSKGLTSIHIGQTAEAIAEVHAKAPIDWFVYSSALPKENPNHPELVFCQQHVVKSTKRDEFLSNLLTERNLKLLAIAGTHGKTTTTAMLVWLAQKVGLKTSYSVGAKTSFADMGHFEPGSEYFIYECDEYDRNFLAFYPFMSLISGIAYDHHDIYPTEDSYRQAFRDFLGQSQSKIVWRSDVNRLGLATDDTYLVLDDNSPEIADIKLVGEVNRQDAWLVVQATHQLTKQPVDQLINHMNDFPGVSRRFEQIAPGLYSDYAHTPEKIRGAIEVALEANPGVVVVYEGLHNRRQHFMKDSFRHLFDGVKKIYWVPSYLAREDPNLALLSPAELIKFLGNPSIAEPAELNEVLQLNIKQNLEAGSLVLCISAGGGGSLDEWLRKNFTS